MSHVFDDQEYSYGLEDFNDYDYMQECPRCCGSRYGSGGRHEWCDSCEEEEEMLRHYNRDNQGTKAERREAKREKAKYAPVRHLEADVRPAKFTKYIGVKP